jgi:hypothetical protein
MKWMVVSIAILCAASSRPAIGAPALNFPPSDFDILDADTAKVIGHGHCELDRVGDELFLHGLSRYATGEFDTEEDQLSAPPDRPLPLLMSFRHEFYNADGSLFIDSRFDRKTGVAACGKTENSKLDLNSERVEAPEDTYAGLTLLLPVQDYLHRAGRGRVLKLHVFSCVPTPKLVAVDVTPQAQSTSWANYPGQLEKIDITPNFGFWTVVIQPFIPKLGAWFDPSRDALLVGAQLQRYYRGPKIIMVRSREPSVSVNGAVKKSPSVAGTPPP